MKRIEGLLLVAILLVVGGFAGAASFTHVKDWTMANSPAGTGEWFGWANAVISELIPMAALLVIRQRRRTGGSVGYPMFLLVCAAGLSLSAQLAVAKPGPSGWLLSAVPALAFLGLSKLVLAGAPATPPAVAAAQPPASVPAPAVPPVQAAPSVVAPAAPVPAEPVRALPDEKAGKVPTPTRPGLVPVPVTAFPTRPREAAL
ncbi:DUF2637 domain-containing protein [Actinoplanes derwentensis]|uniref:DUF2637 domain-containing protein n=1 Tax=Actinoplanes derwentensis TaxID=113562 RepID=A0A1H2CC20_9ACTN|nr:DUF2637 domain-containing protein [Actinoplanes derwentensis]GID87296.1 hypothetical protein Ade03nite_62200 [Actinoplanes derwentensis]SDT67991.1 hypothetical protein SAMN04489716_5557 [Actinoplanes derwentensis]